MKLLWASCNDRPPELSVVTHLLLLQSTSALACLFIFFLDSPWHLCAGTFADECLPLEFPSYQRELPQFSSPLRMAWRGGTAWRGLVVSRSENKLLRRCAALDPAPSSPTTSPVSLSTPAWKTNKHAVKNLLSDLYNVFSFLSFRTSTDRRGQFLLKTLFITCLL